MNGLLFIDHPCNGYTCYQVYRLILPQHDNGNHLTDSMLATCIHVAHNVALYAGDVYTRKYFPAQIRSLLILKFFTEMFLSSVSFAISLCRHLYYFLYRLLLLQFKKYFGNFQSFYKDFANIITQRE